jgi:hypothetical protein
MTVRLDDPKRDVAERDRLADPLQDRKQDDRGRDVRDDGEDLEQRAGRDPRVEPSFQDVARVVQNGVVEEERGDREDERPDEPQTCDPRGPLS